MSFGNMSDNPNVTLNQCQPQHQSPSITSNADVPLKGQDEEHLHQQVMKKIADCIVSIHTDLLTKSQNIQIFRQLSANEQGLLQKLDKTSSLHTIYAGILAIDSCLKCLTKQQKFIMNNLIRGISTHINNHNLLDSNMTITSQQQQTSIKWRDSLKYILKQIQNFPVNRGMENQFQRISLMAQKGEGAPEDEGLLSEVYKENSILKTALKQKQITIQSLTLKLKKQSLIQPRTSTTLPKNSPSESSSTTTIQAYNEQMSRLRQQMLQKNTIILKMNQEYANEMQKYNVVFKRLQDQNQLLKKYNDVDAVFMLEELVREVQMLREEKIKDEMILDDIRRKMEVVSFGRREHRGKYEMAPKYEATGRCYPNKHNYDSNNNYSNNNYSNNNKYNNNYSSSNNNNYSFKAPEMHQPYQPHQTRTSRFYSPTYNQSKSSRILPQHQRMQFYHKNQSNYQQQYKPAYHNSNINKRRQIEPHQRSKSGYRKYGNRPISRSIQRQLQEPSLYQKVVLQKRMG